MEIIENLFRMDNDHPTTKIASLGWLKSLQKWEKLPVKKRKTTLYKKVLLQESNVDWTDPRRLTAEREKRNELVRARMDHPEKWEKRDIISGKGIVEN